LGRDVFVLIYPLDGILGIGPDKLSSYNNPEKKVFPTLVSTMTEKGIIDHNVFSVYFQPVDHNAKEPKRINGEIVFGGGIKQHDLKKRLLFLSNSKLYIVEQRHVIDEVKYVPTTSNIDFAVKLYRYMFKVPLAYLESIGLLGC
jgi:hypothetical protein